MEKRVLIVGLGGIGQALLKQALADPQTQQVVGLSRREIRLELDGLEPEQANASRLKLLQVGYQQPESYLPSLKPLAPFTHVWITLGMLQDKAQGIRPEKRFKSLDIEVALAVTQTNCFLPMWILQQLLPLIDTQGRAKIAILSARVGSISDNRLGGWYSYRASKAALNMMIKTLSIELKRGSPELTLLGLHPGTVETDLSAPFRGNVPEHKLFTAPFAAEKLWQVMERRGPEDSGLLFDWDNQLIEP
ncbi:MAG: SDR family NAD(P)-dependent oxidoreductase [Pseudomonadota bacterium]|nr:SDR family NAD(P)-dependent oxidoreductase [Pseudomonadota bacterium]